VGGGIQVYHFGPSLRVDFFVIACSTPDNAENLRCKAGGYAATIVASAIENRIMIRPGAHVPHHVIIGGPDLVIENGAGRDMLSSRMVALADDAAGREIPRLSEIGYQYILAEIDRDVMISAGVLIT